MPEGTFAVRHDREMSWAAAHSPRSPQFTDRFGPLAHAVRNQADGFTDDADAPTPGPGGPGVTPGEFGLLVGQCTGSDEVGRHPVSAFLAQPAQVAADFRIQSIRGCPFGKIGPPFSDVLLASARPTFWLAPDRRFPAVCGSRTM